MITIAGQRYVTVAEACKRLKLDPYPVAAMLVQGHKATDPAVDLDLGTGCPRLRVERHLGLALVPMTSVQHVGKWLKQNRAPYWRLISLYEERLKWQSNKQQREKTETALLDYMWRLSPSSSGHPRQPV